MTEGGKSAAHSLVIGTVPCGSSCVMDLLPIHFCLCLEGNQVTRLWPLSLCTRWWSGWREMGTHAICKFFYMMVEKEASKNRRKTNHSLYLCAQYAQWTPLEWPKIAIIIRDTSCNYPINVRQFFGEAVSALNSLAPCEMKYQKASRFVI